jgi:hypothetical protein
MNVENLREVAQQAARISLRLNHAIRLIDIGKVEDAKVDIDEVVSICVSITKKLKEINNEDNHLVIG